MADLLKDSRFGNIAKDPKFRSMPKSKRKIKIDERFRPMLTNKEFCVKYKFDKRGRPVNQSSAENLRKYYGGSSDDDTDDNEDHKSQDADDSELESDNEQIESDNSEKSDKLQEKNELKQSNKLKTETTKKARRKLKKKTETKNEADSNEHDSDDDDDDNEVDGDEDDDDDENKDKVQQNKNETKNRDSNTTQKLKDLSVDYARGHANLYSDSSSSEEDESEASDLENIIHKWGELDNDAEEINETTTRLALCNMDWDRIRAVDIMALVISFLPPGGLVKSVTIYPTEFGLERMKEEELKGPIEITEDKKIEEEDDNNTDDEDSAIQKEKIRLYQLKRLQYYFALIVLDSKETAEAIYRALDGFEYESSSNKMDLRVITDDRVFDQEPKEVCDKYPDSTNYKPRLFTTKAMQQVKCASTWDETSFERQEIAEKMNKGRIDEINHDDISKYVATSSSEDEPEIDNDNNLDQIKEIENNQSKKKNKNDIAIYKLLLQQNAENEKKKKKSDIDFECEWGMREENDLKENTEKLVKKKIDEKEKEKLTPFDKYKLKIQEKKKAKKLKKKQLKNKTGNGSDSEDSIPSDVDMNDPYFKEEMMMNMKPNKAKNKKSKKNAVDSDDEAKKQENAELELLLLDKEDDKLKNHFDMNKIEQNEALSKSKKKRLMKKNKGNNSEFEDKFEINVEDPRFTAVYDSPDFHIDPTDPHFRNTKGTELIRKEKFKRQGQKISNHNNDNNIPVEEPPVKRPKNTKSLDDDVNALVKRIKSNTKNISQKIK
ncbi:GSCOCG00001027001-RA-CDS [Cotesia congregata]|uniref:Similar to Esf1: ESF1 homolog (Mus musculus) n=1 Tax=Cotesia congregata TaxID=51543 RepID=A0A8J2MPY8_COTCN|nr:GSCOCG00001027001-RA-CDS [Cotesia congregata]CAG5095985.1 Similar to Esf1: ESF1 homolog (Mus musculus) [Cotesia congregata]